MSRSVPHPIDNATKALGARLRVEREAHGISLEDFARAMGGSINTIRWHEAGSRMLRGDDLVQAARILLAYAWGAPKGTDEEGADNRLIINILQLATEGKKEFQPETLVTIKQLAPDGN